MAESFEPFDGTEFKAELEDLAASLRSLNFEVKPLVFDRPATESEVAAIEEQLGKPLPSSFRRVVLQVSRHVEFRWFAPRERAFPKPFHDSFCGDVHWSLNLLPELEVGRQGWVKTVFPNPDDPYDVVWHDKLAFYEVGNGDQLALNPTGQVIYLSHDDGDGHGYTMASSFDDLLRRWLPLAFVGGEDWQWMPFTSDTNSGLEPREESASAWRSLLGL